MRERSSRPGRLYAAIPNEVMRDAEISMEARGLLALLMTYSDEWEFRKDHLLEVTKWGRDKFERHMGELVSAGYVERVQTREEGTGKLLGSSWIIRDDRGPENQGVGDTEALKNRPTVKPTHGESAPIRKNKREEEQTGRNIKGDFETEPSLFSDMTQPESKGDRPESAMKKKEDPALAILRTRLGEKAALDFLAHRRALRKPLTPRAAELIVGKLNGCKDPDAVVNLSIMNGWQGLFPDRAPQPAQASTGGYRPVPRWDEDRIER